jgi:rubredoxin
MDPERRALVECDSCHPVYGSDTVSGSAACHVCGGTTFTYVRNLRAGSGSAGER